MQKQKISFDQILDSIVDKNSISKTFARTLVKELTALIQEGLLKDSTVSLAGFGIFRLHTVPERTGRNIQNGQPIIIPAHRKVLFKPEKHIRELINKKYEELKAQISNPGKKPQVPQSENKKDKTETDITLSAIAESLDSMVRDEPKKREAQELSDQPVLMDDIIGAEQKEKENTETSAEKSNKKLYIGATLIALLILIFLFIQFTGDDTDEVEIAETNKPAVESVSPKEENSPPKPAEKTVEKQAIKYKTITSARGDNLWNLSYKHYRDGYLWPLILQANKAQISNPDLIEPGVELKIPELTNPQKLTQNESRMLSDGHLTAYFEYKDLKRREALNHLFVADKYDHENVKNSLAKIDNSDYESIRSFTMK